MNRSRSSHPLRIKRVARWVHALLLIGVLLFSPILSGCSNTEKKLHYLGDAELNYYKTTATEVAYPDVGAPVPDPVGASVAPRNLRDLAKEPIWDMTLAEALHTAMENGDILLSNAQFLAPQNTLYTNAEYAPSIYDTAIQESGILFGRRGVEAALADFDAKLNASMLWTRNEAVQNTPFAGGFPGSTLTTDLGAFRSSIDKQLATGGRVSVAHDWDYLGSNAIPFVVLFPSSYTGNVRLEYRQPLLAAAGTEYTRVAGPTIPGFGPITGVSQGVVIARINADISIADFEANVRNMLKDVEDVYWELYLRYRVYDAAVVARNSALRTWRDATRILKAGGLETLTPADEARAREGYFDAVALTQQALNEIYSTETRVRRILGLPVNDGRVIRPVDEPTTSQVVPDWYTALAEALTNRVELRKQKWLIKSLSLQLEAAHSLTRPQLDFISNYRVNGFGDTLLDDGDNDGVTAQGLNSAYETLTQGDHTGWNLGFQFSMPFGFRAAHAQVRNLELRLVKARKVLSKQELEISHELAYAIQQLAAHYEIAETNLNRMQASRERRDLVEQQLDAGRATVDDVLRAQAAFALAERNYHTSLVRHVQAIADFEFRKGTLLEYDNVYLSEGEWSPQAYREALRRAWDRSHAFDCNHLETEPAEFQLSGKPEISLDQMPPELHPDEPTRPPGFEKSTVPPPPAPPASDAKSQPPGPALSRAASAETDEPFMRTKEPIDFAGHTEPEGRAQLNDQTSDARSTPDIGSGAATPVRPRRINPDELLKSSGEDLPEIFPLRRARADSRSPGARTARDPIPLMEEKQSPPRDALADPKWDNATPLFPELSGTSIR